MVTLVNPVSIPTPIPTSVSISNTIININLNIISISIFRQISQVRHIAIRSTSTRTPYNSVERGYLTFDLNFDAWISGSWHLGEKNRRIGGRDRRIGGRDRRIEGREDTRGHDEAVYSTVMVKWYISYFLTLRQSSLCAIFTTMRDYSCL